MFTSEESWTMNHLEQKPFENAIKFNSTSDVNQEEWVSLSDSLASEDEVGGMVVKSVNMRRVLKTIQRLGPYKGAGTCAHFTVHLILAVRVSR
jgi:hypothetical protein